MPGVKFTCEVLPGGTFSLVKTIPPTAATYGANLWALVKFHCQITGRMLPPQTAPAGGRTRYMGKTSAAHSKFPRRNPGRKFGGRNDSAAPAGVAELRAARMAQARAGARQKSKLNGVLAQGLMNPVAIVGGAGGQTRLRRGRSGRGRILRREHGRAPQRQKCGQPELGGEQFRSPIIQVEKTEAVGLGWHHFPLRCREWPMSGKTNSGGT